MKGMNQPRNMYTKLEIPAPDLNRKTSFNIPLSRLNLPRCSSMSQEVLQSTDLFRRRNGKNSSLLQTKMSFNQLSHYITLIVLGFYFIITTIPFSIVLAFTNQLTLKLNYYLPDQESYLSDETWITYGQFRDLVMLFKLFFISNHCLNFLFYLTFNRLFRRTLVRLLNLNNKSVCF